MGAIKLSPSSENQLNQLFNEYWKFLSNASLNALDLCKNLETTDFIKFVSLRNHKSRGVDVENRLMIKNNWEKMKRSAELGDLTDDNGKNVEVKSSIVTPNKDSRVTLRGFRKWEKVDYYIAVILDIKQFSEDPKYYIYKITPDLITQENGFTPDNQSKKARAGNTNISVGISFDIGDDRFVSWERYRTNLIRF